MSVRIIQIAAISFLALIVTVAIVSLSFAANEMPTHSASTPEAVKGEVLMITDEFLVVKEPTGKGVQLLFGTDVAGRPRQGHQDHSIMHQIAHAEK